MTNPLERRQTPGCLELRAGTGGQKIGGYALKYATYSQNLGGYVETIHPGTFTKSLADGGDVLCRYQHDSDMLLGRTSSQTLRLADDEVGLDYEADLPDTSYARDLAALAARGDVRHSSFAFRCLPDGDSWGFTEMGFPLRTLREAQLVDTAPVVTPAYLDTSSGLRSLAEQRGLDLDTVARAAAANQLAELMRAAAPVVIDLKTPDSNPPRDTHGLLTVRQLRADLHARRSTL
jgi:HK97 family phage prohead protease